MTKKFGRIRILRRQSNTQIIEYDVALGVIRMIDSTQKVASSSTVSPIQLTHTMREDIKKPILAEVVN